MTAGSHEVEAVQKRRLDTAAYPLATLQKGLSNIGITYKQQLSKKSVSLLMP